jgi:hypothetical protein
MVELWCHSLNYGMYRDLKRPPKIASRVLIANSTDQFAALGYDNPNTAWGDARAYDMLKESPDVLASLYDRDDKLAEGLEKVSEIGSNPVAAGIGVIFGPAAALNSSHYNWRKQYAPVFSAIFTVQYVRE